MTSERLGSESLMVFLAGAFVGATVGPSVVQSAVGALEARSKEIGNQIVDCFLSVIQSGVPSATGARSGINIVREARES